MRVLFLDDMRERHEMFMRNADATWKIDQAYTLQQAIDMVKKQLDYGEERYGLMFLDHDLSIEMIMCDPHDISEENGSRFAEWLVAAYSEVPDEDKPEVVCHSLNPAGRENMYQILTDCGFVVNKIPFTALFRR